MTRTGTSRAGSKPGPAKPAAKGGTAAAPKPAARPRATPPASLKASAAALRKRQIAAGPDAVPKRPRKPKVTPDRLEQLVAVARTSLEDDKAEDIRVLDVTGRSDFTDCMIIATGQVERQLQAMAVHVEEALEKAGRKLRRSDIQASPDWVLIDAGDLVIHLFRPEARATYALERMWGPESPAPEGAASG